jgi:glycine/D-amino acid oxidase-like deaminating enzyme
MSGEPRAVEGCFWQLDLSSRDIVALEGTLKTDVAVIGAGYTGLATAYHLKAVDPTLDVTILEAETVGYGASGRNAGFVMTLFGASTSLMKSLHGGARVRAAYDYMMSAIAGLEQMIAAHAIDCDFERTGFLKVATAPAYVDRIRKEVDFLHTLGIGGVTWIDKDEVRARVDSRAYLGAIWEPACGLLHPVKWLEGLRRIACAAGARLFERSPVTSIAREKGRFRVETPKGTLLAEKIVFATNGYSHLIPDLRFKQLPAFAHVVVTKPLSADQRAAIQWQGREGIEDARNFMHFYRLTPDNRLLAGGGPGRVPFGRNMALDGSPAAWRHLERFIGETFPPLRGIAIDYRWGGAFSVTADSTPQIGTLHGGSAVYALGCAGHGVAMSHMNGRVLRDLVLARETELTDLWFVNRRALPLPPEPLRWLAARAAMRAMAIDDWWCERGRPRN